MDTYLIVNAVQLGTATQSLQFCCHALCLAALPFCLAPGFTVMAFCEGRLASGTPTWLVGCHTLSLAGSLVDVLVCFGACAPYLFALSDLRLEVVLDAYARSVYVPLDVSGFCSTRRVEIWQSIVKEIVDI